MRLPIRSEADAFRFTWGLAVVIGLCLLAGYLIAPLAGILLFVAVVVAGLVWEVRSDNPDQMHPLTDAEQAAPRRDAGAPLILVVSNQTLGGQELKDELLRRGEPRPTLRVVAPILTTRTHYVTTDIDREREQARVRLESTLAWARERGFECTGEVGDQNPFTAIEDQLRRYGADEILISTHIAKRSHWLEAGLVERVRDEVTIPVTHVMVDVERQQTRVAPG